MRRTDAAESHRASVNLLVSHSAEQHSAALGVPAGVDIIDSLLPSRRAC